MTRRTSARPTGFRRIERWMVGLVFAIMAFVLEKVVMHSARKKDSSEAEEVTTMISKGGEVDVDL